MAGGALPHPLLLSTILHMDEIEIAGKMVEFKPVFYTWCGLIILLILGYFVKKNIDDIPGKLQNVFETLLEAFENFITQNMGETNAKRFTPLLVSIFFYIITLNLLGLVPGFDAPTANVNTTASMAIFVFLYYNYIGIQRWGAHYIGHFTGPMAVLIPLMLPLEIISHCARPLSLTLRLFGNIFGEEKVIVLFFILAPLIGTIPIYGLFLLGKSLQAFIFFMLTMIYINGAVEHAH